MTVTVRYYDGRDGHIHHKAIQYLEGQFWSTVFYVGWLNHPAVEVIDVAFTE